jgi:hypothetical protein
MAISISAISKDWGCARSYVQRCVKRGCPTDSFESARLWRQANQQRSRNPVRDAGESPAPDAQEFIKQNVSHGTNIPEDLGHDLLMGSKEAVRQSWRYLREALLEGKVQKIGAWISLHTRAVEANVKVESMVREERERQKILIPLSEAQSMAGKVIGVIVSRLNALPQNVATRSDLTDSQMTMTVLEDECGAILKDAQQAL